MELRAMQDTVSRLSAPKINAGTITGRMSASAPNLQNWSPKKDSKVKIIVDPSS
jgi:DNA polymerase I-like protein with 3'-5' exonuclease and polymerase domains